MVDRRVGINRSPLLDFVLEKVGVRFLFTDDRTIEGDGESREMGVPLAVRRLREGVFVGVRKGDGDSKALLRFLEERGGVLTIEGTEMGRRSTMLILGTMQLSYENGVNRNNEKKK